ncbi:MAG: FKBP-type peptidyl-prolyl cis-trans isomerase [Myxococcaceae bacterium]
MMTRLCCVVALVGLVGCAPDPKLEDAMYAASLGVDLSASTKLAAMYFRDVTVGSGAEAKSGNLVTMRYTGWLANGTQFDSNQASGFQFQVGAGDVIQGWDLGVVGMKVGGERQLIIPPSMGYGASGNGPIPPNAILVFKVTMMSTP